MRKRTAFIARRYDCFLRDGIHPTRAAHALFAQEDARVRPQTVAGGFYDAHSCDAGTHRDAFASARR